MHKSSLLVMRKIQGRYGWSHWYTLSIKEACAEEEEHFTDFGSIFFTQATKYTLIIVIVLYQDQVKVSRNSDKVTY